MIKAILFDLDGTILDRNASLKHFLARQYDRLAEKLNKITKIDYISRFIELDCRGYAGKEKVYKTILSEFHIQTISWEELVSDREIYFIDSCIPFPNLIETLETLTKTGYLLGIITNGRGTFQRRKIKILGIEKYFPSILISEIEGISKPAAEIFLRALSNLGVLADESVFIGDHPENDIMGAQRVGMKTIWKRDSGWEVPNNPDGIIDDLGELPLVIHHFV
jgi:putative hydrolase of the HAD superfamily